MRSCCMWGSVRPLAHYRKWKWLMTRLAALATCALNGPRIDSAVEEWRQLVEVANDIVIRRAGVLTCGVHEQRPQTRPPRPLVVVRQIVADEQDFFRSHARLADQRLEERGRGLAPADFRADHQVVDAAQRR